jgi:hypothetical protein
VCAHQSRDVRAFDVLGVRFPGDFGHGSSSN